MATRLSGRLVVHMRSEAHLTRTNVEDRHNVLQKYVAEDEDTVSQSASRLNASHTTPIRELAELALG